MLRLMEVFGRVLARRGITAANVASVHGVFTLKRAQPVAQMENDGNPRKIDSQVFPQPSDHAQPRHNVFVEQQSCAFASARLDQSAINEGLNDCGMKARAFGKPFERQPLILWPAKNYLVSPYSHRLGINSRASKRDSLLSFSKSFLFAALRRGELTIFSLAY
jgi:hypothetical protein